jgi:hypothetical protein
MGWSLSGLMVARDECIAEGVELGLALSRITSEQLVDLILDHPVHPAHRLVRGHRQITVSAEVAVEPLQSKRQQRQRIPTLAGLRQQPTHQRRFDT